MMRLQWTQDLDIETPEARGHRATMEDLLEVVPCYESNVMICETSPSLKLTPQTKHLPEICSHLSVHHSEGVASHDLSIFHGGHDCYS